MTKVLYIGRHPEILETVLRLINAKEDWFALGAESDEEAISLFQKHEFDVVLLGCGLSDECEKALTQKFGELNPEIPVVLHYGGGSGLLTNELLSALA